MQLIAEVLGTYFLIFAGCGSIVVNKIYGSITFPGVAVVWGLTAMVMIYSVGHISGAHFNPAVTLTFAIFRDFPLKQAYYYANSLSILIVSKLLDNLLINSVHIHAVTSVHRGAAFRFHTCEWDVMPLFHRTSGWFLWNCTGWIICSIFGHWNHCLISLDVRHFRRCHR